MPAKPSFDMEDLGRLAQMIYGEARGQGDAGMQAVGQVALNRMRDKRYPDKMSDVVMQPKQFSAFWDNQRPKMENAYRNDPEGWAKAVKAAHSVLQGEAPDRVGDATHYWAPKGMAGGIPPKWSGRVGGERTRLGGHIFEGKVRPSDEVGGVPQRGTDDAAAANAPAARADMRGQDASPVGDKAEETEPDAPAAASAYAPAGPKDIISQLMAQKGQTPAPSGVGSAPPGQGGAPEGIGTQMEQLWPGDIGPDGVMIGADPARGETRQ